MKLFEIFQVLVEYKRDITQQKLGDRLVQAAQRDRKQDIDTILTSLESMDPTKNKQYVEWLCRQYIKGMFRLEDRPHVIDTLTKFEQIKPRLPQRDINRYTFHNLSDEMDKQYKVELSTDDDNVKDAKILYKGPLGQLSVPLSQEASCALGSGTKWCTAAREDNMFKYYNATGPLYIWKDKSGDKYQFYFGGEYEFMDARNRAISNEQLKEFRTKHPVISKLFKNEEARIAKDAHEAYVYARDIIGGRFPEAEDTIALDNGARMNYQADVLYGERFPAYENLLISRKDISSIIQYIDSLDRKYQIIPELEKAVFEYGSPNQLEDYAATTGLPLPDEQIKKIGKDPGAAYQYAMVYPHSAELLSDSIAQDSYYAVLFARNVLNNAPFPAGEDAISEDWSSSLQYAISCLGDRFPKGEPVMRENPDIWRQYIRFLKSNNKELPDEV